MNASYSIVPVAKIGNRRGEVTVRVEKEFIPALERLQEFSHVTVLWWAHHLDTKEARSVTQVEKPYRTSPDVMGIFATRSPMRPNPVAASVCGILGVDMNEGLIRLDWIDADDGTPVIDLKPYIPCADRVRAAKGGSWCADWPSCVEDSAEFDWTSVFGGVE